MNKVGRGCCNKKATSGRMDNYFTRKIEIGFRGIEFIPPGFFLSSFVIFFGVSNS
jgi:hypothetical protein